MTKLMAHHTCVSLRALQAAEPQGWQGPQHRLDTVPKSVQVLWHLLELLGNLGPHRALWCWDCSPTLGRRQRFCWRVLPRRGKHLSTCDRNSWLSLNHRMETIFPNLCCSRAWPMRFELKCSVVAYGILPSKTDGMCPLPLPPSCHWKCGCDGWSSSCHF